MSLLSVLKREYKKKNKALYVLKKWQWKKRVNSFYYFFFKKLKMGLFKNIYDGFFSKYKNSLLKKKKNFYLARYFRRRYFRYKKKKMFKKTSFLYFFLKRKIKKYLNSKTYYTLRKKYKKILKINMRIFCIINKTNDILTKYNLNKIKFRYPIKSKRFENINIKSYGVLSGYSGLFKHSVSNTFSIRSRSLIDFSIFRLKNVSMYIRLNYHNNMFVHIFNKINHLFSHFGKKGYDSRAISVNFTMLILTKDVLKFTIFLRTLLLHSSRREQKRFFHIFSCIPTGHVGNVLEFFDVVGLYIKVSGKIGGFAGDRTRFFLIKYKSISRSIRNYKYNYYQKQLNTRNGTAGITTMILFKNCIRLTLIIYLTTHWLSVLK